VKNSLRYKKTTLLKLRPPLLRSNLPYGQLRRWKYDEKKESVHGGCYDCGLYYGCDAWADVHLPNDVWDMINPSEYKGGGLLCLNCITRRLEFLGLEEVPFEITSGPLSK